MKQFYVFNGEESVYFENELDAKQNFDLIFHQLKLKYQRNPRQYQEILNCICWGVINECACELDNGFEVVSP